MTDETSEWMHSATLKQKDAIRVKVILETKNHLNSQCCRFSIAPELTSYDVLRNFIIRAFDIKTDFVTSYLCRNESQSEAFWLPLCSNFDLELAYNRAADPILLIKTKLVESSKMVDISSIDLFARNIPNLAKNHYAVKIPEIFKDKVEKTFSIVQKAFNWTEEEEIENLPLRNPLNDAEFQSLLDPLGTLLDSRELRLRVYSSGIEPSLRKVVWKHLLNVYPDKLSGKQRMDYMKKLNIEYENLKKSWSRYVEDTENINEEVQYVTNLIRKDVLRTDRQNHFYNVPDDHPNLKALYNVLTTYALNHPTISYCQGMSDIASPLLVIMKDEAQTYACFCALMLRLRPNFLLDGVAMTLKFLHLTEALAFYDKQFYEYLRSHQADDFLFCYRWLLLELKREFSFNDALFMLEVLWSSIPPDPPSEKLELVEVLFNPSLKPLTKISSLRRCSNYENICFIRRRNSACLKTRTKGTLRIHERRAVSFDNPHLDTKNFYSGSVKGETHNNLISESANLNQDKSNSLSKTCSSVSNEGNLSSSANVIGATANQVSDVDSLSSSQQSFNEERSVLKYYERIKGTGEISNNNSTSESKNNINLSIPESPESPLSETFTYFSSESEQSSPEKLCRKVKNLSEFQKFTKNVQNFDKSEKISKHSVEETNRTTQENNENTSSADYSAAQIKSDTNLCISKHSDLAKAEKDRRCYSESDVNDFYHTDVLSKKEVLDEHNCKENHENDVNHKCENGAESNECNGADNVSQFSGDKNKPASEAENSLKVKINSVTTPSLPPPSEFGGGNPFLIFLCITLLIQHRQYIMDNNLDHNDLAMYFDKLVRKHDLHKVLMQARNMFESYLKVENAKPKSSTCNKRNDLDEPC